LPLRKSLHRIAGNLADFRIRYFLETNVKRYRYPYLLGAGKMESTGILVGRRQGKRALERTKHGWEDNIKMDL
jgi:hypothetical protein